MNNHFDSNLGRDRSATFGVGENSFSLGNNDNDPQGQNFESYLSRYEYLRLNYENEGISQQSLILLRRLSQSFHEKDPTLSNLPILKEMINVCKKLMFNDFEILIWAIYLKETLMNREDLVAYLSTSGMFVKKDLNEPDVFKIFETFLAHNHYDTYEKYANASKPQVTLTLKRINYYHMTLLAPFEISRDKEVQDFNFEVDALEDEHVRREVHTTKIVANDGQDAGAKKDQHSENSLTEKNSQKGNKRVRKDRAQKPKPKPNLAKQQAKQIIDEKLSKHLSVKDKRESKKSFDMYTPEDRSENASESPFSANPRFAPMSRSPQIHATFQKRQNVFSNNVGPGGNKAEDKSNDNNLFGSMPTTLTPAIPPPFKRPMLSVESIGGGLGGFEKGFENMDNSLDFNMINKSFERIQPSVSREFMERAHQDQNDNKGFSSFKCFTPNASGEFGGVFGNNDQPRNLLHPTPKYQK
jgi:hypothetical protein